MNPEYILEALEERLSLIQAIDSLIETHFQPNPKTRLKRGQVQEFILSTLKVARSSLTCKIINERMQAKGYRPYIMKGTLYFHGVTSSTYNYCPR